MAYKVGMFVTCLADFFRPSVGFAALDLLEAAGCEVHVRDDWVCCGQPGYNSGATQEAREVARPLLHTTRDLDYLVIPSGSCAGMIMQHYTDLFADDVDLPLAQELAAKTRELTAFLVEIDAKTQPSPFPHSVVYADSCSAWRESNTRQQPRDLLDQTPGLNRRELATPDVCCGFGGTFCVKYPEISDHMVSDKAQDVRDSRADVLTGPDLGCLLNIAGKLSRQGAETRVYHVAEILAGLAEKTPPLGRSAEEVKAWSV